MTSPSPASGPAGTHLTLTGSGFYGQGPIGYVQIWLTSDSGTYLLSLAFVPSGTAEPFSVNVDFPGVGVEGGLTLGTYYLWALNDTTPADCAEATFNLTGVDPGLACESWSPELYVTLPAPAVGEAGTLVSLQGVGFYDDNTTYIYWAAADGSGLTYLVSVTSSASGGGFNVTAEVPSGFAAGTYFFWGEDGTSDYDCAGAEFALTAAAGLTLDPTSGPPGSLVTATGTGFAPDSPIEFTLDSEYAASSCSTDATGSFPGASGTPCTFTVPLTPNGDEGGQNVVAVDTSLGRATASFSVTPEVHMSPKQGPIGAAFTLSGSGFSASPSAAVVDFAGSELAPTGGSDCSYDGPEITLDLNGGFVCAFAAPSWATVGANAVQGDDTASDEFTAVETFTVTTPALTLLPVQGPSGVTVTASGSGFTPNVTVAFAVSAGGTIGSAGSCTASGTGAFSGCTFTVSGSSMGYTVTASGSDAGSVPADTATATYTVTTPTVVEVSSTTGAPGPVTFSLSGLAPNTVYDVYLDTTPGVAATFLGTCTSSATGTLTDCTVQIPGGLAVGTYYVDVFQDPTPLPYILSVFHFTVASPPPAASHPVLFGLPSLDYEIFAGALVVAAVGAVVIVGRRRRRR